MYIFRRLAQWPFFCITWPQINMCKIDFMRKLWKICQRMASLQNSRWRECRTLRRVSKNRSGFISLFQMEPRDDWKKIWCFKITWCQKGCVNVVIQSDAIPYENLIVLCRIYLFHKIRNISTKVPKEIR